MGADLQKELAAALHDPENEKKMKKVFKHADKDKSGALDKAEFVALGKVIFKVDVEDAKKEVKDAVKQEFGTGFAAKMVASMAAKGLQVGLKMICDEENINQFAADLFKEYDSDQDQTISFEEFKNFLQKHNSKPACERLDLQVEETQ